MLDLFVGKKTREHKDIEISVWRDQASLLFERFPKNQVDMVVGHKRYETLKKDSVIDRRGHLVIRDLSIENHKFDIELFTTERNADHWIFRKQVDVQVPLNEAILTASCGTQYLAPQMLGNRLQRFRNSAATLVGETERVDSRDANEIYAGDTLVGEVLGIGEKLGGKE